MISILQITLNTVNGQCLDMTVAPPPGCVDFTKYTLEKYKAIVKWKTAFYSFYLPVALAMYMVSYAFIGTTSQAESSLVGLRATQTKYTLEKYKAIVKWKTAFYSFYLPLAIAMYMVSYAFIGTTSQAESSLVGLRATQIKSNYML